MKKFLHKLTSTVLLSTMLLSSVFVFAAELPETIVRDGRTFVMDTSTGGGKNTAMPDSSMIMTRSSYKVLGSDVQLYVDYSHGHGGDHFASGWVQATAPSFTARAEVWSNGRLDTTGPNCKNKGDTAEATSNLAVGLVKNAEPRIFYKW